MTSRQKAIPRLIKQQYSCSPDRARGASLIVALVLLLVMTLVGVASMQSSTLQERMASNKRERTLALNAAEFALREAEQYLSANITDTASLAAFNGNGGLYSAMPLPTGGTTSPVGAVDLSKAATWTGIGATSVMGLSDEVAVKDPQYIIEYVGRGQLSSTSVVANVVNVDNPVYDVSPYMFRITAIGWGRNEKIYSVIESNYRTGYGDDFFTY